MNEAGMTGERITYPTPSRIALARKRRGLTVAALSRLLGVTPKTVSRWEDGSRSPEPDTLEQVSAVLRMPVAFFMAEDLDELRQEAVSFRALSKMTARERDMSLTGGRLAVEIGAWLRSRFTLPEPNVPTLEGWDPERAAVAVRERWGLGIAPINNMLDVLEAHGIHVFSLAGDCQSVDAFSFTREGQPHVLLNLAKTGERRRFDAAHELGHLVLHCGDEVPHGKDSEAQAQRFAAAFLMPATSIQAAGLLGATVPAILHAKRQWKVAAMALTHRLRELNMLTEWGYRDICVRLSQMGYRSGEPAGAIRPEVSQVLTKIAKSLRAQGVSDAEVASQFALHVEDLGAHLFGLIPLVIQGEGQASTDRARLRVVR
jgi:Zn-dependent peptidase ImmA (M78 family)/DNA-binding XRE family transcriptional regulator